MEFFNDIVDARGDRIICITNENREDGSCIDIGQPDAQRIVACVNFCAGIPTEEIVKRTTDREKGLCVCRPPVAPFSSLEGGSVVFICRGCGGRL